MGRILGFSLFILLILALLGGCRNDNINTDPSTTLMFSADTLTFDTVFVQAGSVVGYVRAVNSLNSAVEISEISLRGIANDQFKINVDGEEVGPFKNVIVPPNDSIYIFVTVEVDPTTDNLPFVIHEDLDFMVNGNLQTVHLMAWGQNVRYYYGEEICDEEWNSQIPYVIVSRTDEQTGEFFPGVEVQEGCTLTIREGTHVYFDGNSSAMFVRGTLRILGTAQDTVVFEGSRLESFFDDIPGQYLGIFIYRASTGNEMEHFIMNEARFGITIGVLDTNDLSLFTNDTRPDLSIRNCVFKNNFSNALYAFNAEIDAENILAYGGTENLLTLALGGIYEFDNCTFYNSGDVASAHDNEVLLISNFAADNSLKVVNGIEANFTNSIIYGTIEDELDLSNDPLGDFNVLFDHCLLKTLKNTDTTGYQDVLVNLSPEFISRSDQDFQLNASSPCIDAAKSNGLTIDLLNRPRPFGTALDIGAYEYQGQ